jgi:selenium metabolism protein YedF
MGNRKILAINCETMGRGSEELGAVLMGSFLRKLCSAEARPEAMLFYNSGVRLLAEGSPVLDALSTLEKLGVDLVACGTCAGYYGLTDKMVVGRISDMGEIVARLLNSEATVTI